MGSSRGVKSHFRHTMGTKLGPSLSPLSQQPGQARPDLTPSHSVFSVEKAAPAPGRGCPQLSPHQRSGTLALLCIAPAPPALLQEHAEVAGASWAIITAEGEAAKDCGQSRPGKAWCHHPELPG